MTSNRGPNKAGGIALRYFLIPLVGGIVIAGGMLALMNSLQVEIAPVGFQHLNISGGPSTGTYEFFFALEDENGINGPSNGYVYLKVTDSNQTMLYRSESLIRSFNFATYSNYTSGAPAVGYRWTVPAANLTLGVPFAGGLGNFEISFVALSGRYMSVSKLYPIPVGAP